jgi:ribonuclease D
MLKPQSPLISATYIDNDAALQQLIPKLEEEPLLAIDTESNSLYVYREQVCLFQISTRTEDYIIDPLSVQDMQPLGAIMANPAIEKVFHAAEYDIMCLKRDYNFELVNLFDTMIAARICAFPEIGLSSLLEKYFDIRVNKKHQRDNWGERPLPLESLQYAQMDTHYLPALRDELYALLQNMGHWEEAQEAFADVLLSPAAKSEFDPHGFWRIGKPQHLTNRQMGILQALYILREQLADKRNKPPFRVLSNQALIEIARVAPTNKGQLAAIKGVGESTVRRDGYAILKAVTEGLNGPLPKQPKMPPPTPVDVIERYNALREWRKSRADARGVESDVIISKNVLRALAEKVPHSLDEMEQIPGLGPWRLSQYGSELLGVLHRS